MGPAPLECTRSEHCEEPYWKSKSTEKNKLYVTWLYRNKRGLKTFAVNWIPLPLTELGYFNRPPLKPQLFHQWDAAFAWWVVDASTIVITLFIVIQLQELLNNKFIQFILFICVFKTRCLTRKTFVKWEYSMQFYRAIIIEDKEVALFCSTLLYYIALFRDREKEDFTPIQCSVKGV